MKLNLQPLSFLLLLAGGAIVFKAFLPNADGATAPSAVNDSDQYSQRYELVANSIVDGDTFSVRDGSKEFQVRLCGIDAPEKEQSLGIASRDHLRSLMESSNGQVILVISDTDQYDRAIAEAFVPTNNPDEEIHLNSQMVADGMAYVYPRYVGGCPNGHLIQAVEQGAQDQQKGVWHDSDQQRPWEFRRGLEKR